jgi:hypothetical protein
MVERRLRDGRRLEQHLDDRTAERSPPSAEGGRTAIGIEEGT